MATSSWATRDGLKCRIEAGVRAPAGGANTAYESAATQSMTIASGSSRRRIVSDYMKETFCAKIDLPATLRRSGSSRRQREGQSARARDGGRVFVGVRRLRSVIHRAIQHDRPTAIQGWRWRYRRPALHDFVLE